MKTKKLYYIKLPEDLYAPNGREIDDYHLLVPIKEGYIYASSEYHALSMFLKRRKGKEKNDGIVFWNYLIENIEDYVKEI